MAKKEDIIKMLSKTRMGKIIGVVGVIVLVVIGLWFWKGRESGTEMAQTGTGVVTREGAPKEVDRVKESGGVVSSIKEAMGLGKTMQCSYAMDQGGQSFQTQVAVSGEKFKSTSVVAGATTHALFDGETQYVWTDQNQQGLKMSKACLESFKSETTNTSARDYSADFEAAKNVNCEPASNADFAVPADIVFTDQCAMMQESLKMMEKLQGTMPAGVELPSNIPNPAAY